MKTTSTYTYQGQHKVLLSTTPDGYSIECNTCSLPRAVKQAVLFMKANHVTHMVIDGVEIKRGA